MATPFTALSHHSARRATALLRAMGTPVSRPLVPFASVPLARAGPARAVAQLFARRFSLTACPHMRLVSRSVPCPRAPLTAHRFATRPFSCATVSHRFRIACPTFPTQASRTIFLSTVAGSVSQTRAVRVWFWDGEGGAISTCSNPKSSMIVTRWLRFRCKSSNTLYMTMPRD